MPLFGSHRRNDYASPTEQPPQDDVSYDDAPSRNIKGTLFPRRNRSTSPSSTEMNIRGNNGNRSGSGSGLGLGSAGGNGNGAYDDPNVGTNRNGSRRAGFFGRRRSSSFSDGQGATSPVRGSSMRSGAGRSSNSGIFGRNSNLDSNFSKDPAIIGARSKVSDAEEAERQADRALIDARSAVREAREEVKELERTVAEEARLARLKQQEAKAVSKSAKGLGRHG